MVISTRKAENPLRLHRLASWSQRKALLLLASARYIVLIATVLPPMMGRRRKAKERRIRSLRLTVVWIMAQISEGPGAERDLPEPSITHGTTPVSVVVAVAVVVITVGIVQARITLAVVTVATGVGMMIHL